jgi:hypothetical protein
MEAVSCSELCWTSDFVMLLGNPLRYHNFYQRLRGTWGIYMATITKETATDTPSKQRTYCSSG